jgi:hypothetical protein
MPNNVPRLITAFLLCGLCIANGQTTTATLFGVVRDASGAVVPEAKITARNTATSFARTGTSSETGAYLITNLPVGPYSLLIEKEGFRRFVQDGITLEVDQNARVDAHLAVGLLTDSITVSADAIGVDTRAATVGEVVDRLRVQELPVNGRNVMQLAKLIPGVSQVSAPTLVTRGRNGPSASVAGGRDTQNEIRLDDSTHVQLYNNSALNLPSPDALQEFKVLTSGFNAEYGRYGGGVFIAVTRAGTNEFHGSLWEYLRNKTFDARNFFSADKPDLKQNQFGFTFGGPVIPKRTFFFGSYEGTRIRQSQVLSSATPPTAAERAGNFSASARQPVDPVTKVPFPGGRIPSSSFDQTAVRLMEKYVPLPNTASGAFVTLSPVPSNGNQYLWRVDHSFSSRNSLNIRYFRDDGDTISQAGNLPGWSPNPEGLKVTSWTFHDTHTLTPSLLNEFRIGINRNHSEVTTQGGDQLSDYGANFPGVVFPQLPSLTVTGFFAPATSDRFGEVSNIYQLGNTLRWFHGRHSVSLGGEFTRNEYFGHGASVNQGVISFGGAITTNAFADFLVGKPTLLQQNSTYDRLVKGYAWYLFAQDDIRVSSKLSLNLGLRYEFVPPFKNIYDRVNSYRAGEKSTVVPAAPLGMQFRGDSGFVNRLIPPDKNNFGPRVGIVWDPSGNGQMAFRASYGLFHENFRADMWTYPAVNQPFVISVQVNNPFSLTDMYRGLVNPFPYTYTNASAKFSLPMGLFTVLGPDVTSPYIHHMNFSVERSLPASIVVKAGYSGKLSHNLVRMEQKNPAVYRPGSSTIGNTDSRRILAPYGYGSFREMDTNSGATYHSLQLSLNKRVSKGFTVLGAYTFSKLLDYFSAQNLAATSQDPYNLRGDRSRSGNDRRHIFNMTIVYQLPGFKKGLARMALGGWELASMTSIVSGGPVNITSGLDNSLTGVGNDRPDLVGNPVREHSSKDDMLARFFDPAAFVANQPGRYGNVGRNLINGVAQSTTDLALVKAFPISDRLGKIQFRAEFYNSLNHVNFGGPTASVNNRNFGRILSAGSPRILQFALRYTF